MNNTSDYHLYVLLCDHKTLYTGIAIDPHARLVQHREGHPHGAKFTRRFNHLNIVYQVKVGSRSSAQSLEIKFKKLTKTIKLNIIEQQPNLTDLQGFF